MYIIVKNLSKGSKKNTKKNIFHLRELCYNHADDIL